MSTFLLMTADHELPLLLRTADQTSPQRGLAGFKVPMQLLCLVKGFVGRVN
jgi:hypothetical protein